MAATAAMAVAATTTDQSRGGATCGPAPMLHPVAIYERLDATFMPVLADAVGTSLTAARLSERADDPLAAPLVQEWLEEAFLRGLVNVRRQATLPSDWTLTAKGRRAARRL